MAWEANIAIKTNGKWADVAWDEIKKWPEVENIWSTTGGWDWWVKLKPTANDKIDVAEKVVWNLRKLPWVENTYTWWSKQY